MRRSQANHAAHCLRGNPHHTGSQSNTGESAQNPKVVSNFGSLNRLWKSKSVSRRTKARLYRALVLPLALYNAEVWPIKQQDMKALEGMHFTLLRRMMNLDAEDAHCSRQELLEAFSLPSIAEILSQKRLRWIGHALRRHDNDRSKIAVQETLADATSDWTKLVRQDCKRFNLKFESLAKLAQNRSAYRQVTYVRTGSTPPGKR